MKYRVAVIDNGDTYVRKLFSYMEQQYQTIQIVWIRDIQKEEAILAECDVILASEKENVVLWQEQLLSKVVYLMTKREKRKDVIYLYQSQQELYQEILSKCKENKVPVSKCIVRKGKTYRDGTTLEEEPKETKRRLKQFSRKQKAEQEIGFTEIQLETTEIVVDNLGAERAACGETAIFSELQEAAMDSIRRKCQGRKRETAVLNRKVPYLLRKSTSEKIALDRTIFKIGKDRNYVDYCIHDNPAISRNHAEIVRQDNSFYIIDHHSLNHTYMDGERLLAKQQYKLEDGSRIVFADEAFEFHI